MFLHKCSAFGRLMRLDRPVGTLLLAWSGLWGLWLAGNGQPPVRVVVVILLGTWLMRSAGCVFNDLADRNFDGHVARTRHRPLASGEATAGEALALGVILLFFNFLLVLLLNWQSVLLAVACGAVALFYPLCKRFFLAPQLVLGIAFASPILMAQTAILGTITAAGAWLFAASIIWALIYDTYYALVDREDDEKIGLHSSAITVRGYERRFLALMMLLMLTCLLLAGRAAALNAWYYVGVAAAALLFAWEQWDARHLDREHCFRAFVHNNWVGAAILLGIVLAHLP